MGSTPTISSVASKPSARARNRVVPPRRVSRWRGSHTPSQDRVNPRSSWKEPQQCRGRLGRTNLEVGAGHRDLGQRQSTISRVDFTVEKVRKLRLHHQLENDWTRVNDSWNEPGNDMHEAEEAAKKSCRASVQVRGGTSRGSREIEAFAGRKQQHTHEFGCVDPSRRSDYIGGEKKNEMEEREKAKFWAGPAEGGVPAEGGPGRRRGVSG